MNSSSLLLALQDYLHQRKVSVDALMPASMVEVMLDWFRGEVSASSPADVLLYRYGGWSEGCATGFKLSLLRRVNVRTATGDNTEWFAGVTLMYEPSRLGSLAPFDTISADWPSLQAFARAIESSPAYRMTSDTTPMAVMIESGGLR